MIRSLTDRERDVIVAMLTRAGRFSDEREVTAPERDAWLDQVAGLRVDGVCGCGACSSISLAADSTSEARGADRVVLSATLSDALVLLFIDAGVPSYLELAPNDDTTVYTEFPEASVLFF